MIRPIRFLTVLTCAASSLGFIAQPARAAVIVQVGRVAVTAGSTNDTLDVTLSNTGPAAVNIGAFDFALTSSPALSFTRATLSTTSPYVFAGHSLFGPDITTGTPGSDGSVSASDMRDDFSQTVIASGATVGLGHLIFNVPANTVGPVTVNFNPTPGHLFDAGGNNVAFTPVGGIVTVIPVPEPASLALLTLGGLTLARRRRTAAV